MSEDKNKQATGGDWDEDFKERKDSDSDSDNKDKFMSLGEEGNYVMSFFT